MPSQPQTGSYTSIHTPVLSIRAVSIQIPFSTKGVDTQLTIFSHEISDEKINITINIGANNFMFFSVYLVGLTVFELRSFFTEI